MKEGDNAVLQMYDDEIVGVDLPAAVELTVSETEPGVQGDRVSGARKPATLETGLSCRCRCSSTRATASRSTPAPANTSPGPEPTAARTRCRRGPSPPRGAREGEGPRHEAREHAVALVYEAEMKKAVDPADVLAALSVTPDAFAVAPGGRAWRADSGRIDELVAAAAVGWELNRMPVVDRTILRLATWELVGRARHAGGRRHRRGRGAGQAVLHRKSGWFRERRAAHHRPPR